MPLYRRFLTFFCLLTVVIFASLHTVHPVSAASLTVNTLLDNDTADGLCTLREAITAANTNANYNGCTASGYGADTITFSVTGTISPIVGLPNIMSDITFDGPGSSLLTLSGNLSGYVFQINAGAIVVIEDITLANSNSNVGAVTNAGELMIMNSVFKDNNGGIVSGALYNSGTLGINQTTFSNNNSFVSQGKGGAITNDGHMGIHNSTFNGNYTDTHGGAIYHAGTGVISNNTFYGNTATNGKGGGVYYHAGSLTLLNNTFSNNSAATNSGGGIATNNGDVTITNNIIANSTSGGNCNYAILPTGDSNLSTDNTCLLGSVTTSAALKLGPLADNGGPTRTMLPGIGSSAIDVGNTPAATNNELFTDQRGYTRVVNEIVDIGAVEVQSNELIPTLSLNNVTLTEGNSGTKAFNFTVALSAASAQTVTVNYATGNGSAVAPGDYTAANGILTFNPGETSKQITVMANGETMHELHETFNVNLSNATNATIADNLGVGQINNDDGRPTIRVNDLSRTEGGSGTQTNLPFTVTLSNPSYQTITVQFATSDSSATTADSDYTPIGLTTLSFAPGVISRSVTVKINGDAKHEPHETLNFNLSNPTNATIADALGIGTIANDDSRPTLTVNDVSRAEGNSGTTNFPFVVTLSHPSYQTITVNFATSDVTANAGTDYTARSGSLSFAPGVTSRNITVVGNGDTVFEPNETFNFTLSTAVNATIADGLGIGTISNDDAAGLSEEGVQIVPVAPELPQFLPVAPVMPDAPSVELPGVMLVAPMHASSENPVAFTWIGTADAMQYRVLVQQQHDRASVVDVTVSAAGCNGNICIFVSQFAPQSSVGYVWTVTPITVNGAGQPSAEAGFSYSPSAPDGIELPGTVIGG